MIEQYVIWQDSKRILKMILPVERKKQDTTLSTLAHNFVKY